MSEFDETPRQRLSGLAVLRNWCLMGGGFAAIAYGLEWLLR
ncbi:hypothetical protein [Paracoccus limosus]|nr:hypothetical protein [Paracoccus limosus]